MTKEEESALRHFETRVRQLILQYRDAQRENAQLRTQLEDLQLRAEQLHAENERLRDDYSKLKLAKMMSISDNDMKDAKLRISRLIREVDRCIALLNV